MPFAKGAGSNTLLVRLLAVDPQGGERLLGDFTFNHTRTIRARRPGDGRTAPMTDSSLVPDTPAPATLRPIGVIRSTLTSRHDAPKQGSEGAPDAWLEVYPWAVEGLMGLKPGDEIIVITWLHLGNRETFQVRPRRDPRNPLTGVFATRSPDRPNPLGLHPVVVRAIEGHRLLIGPMEVVDNTPVVDIKPVLC